MQKNSSSAFPLRTSIKTRGSPARVDGFSFQGEDPKDALVDAAKGFTADEALERFDAESEFPLSQGPFATEAA